ncbi:MAG TPA: class I SAM-dependent methyltransferase [Myxococcales bacterium]|nr:class I SAM-dependent methyltransferase [Myxococcales bacterium]
MALDPIAKTAWYGCGIRAADARSKAPICGDKLAERFMTAEATAVYEQFKKLKNRNASNVTRHRIIDDLLRARLRDDAGLRVLLLGAGFDTRAFRLQGGDWLELDQLPIIEQKEGALPSERSPNPLRRIGIDFEPASLEVALSVWGEARPTVVVMESVSMYLDDSQLSQTLELLRRLMPGHLLICDLVNRQFVRRHASGMRKRVGALGGRFAAPHDDPAAFVVHQGYEEEQRISIAGRAVALKAVGTPKWLLDSLFKSLRDGYQVHVFRDLNGRSPSPR